MKNLIVALYLPFVVTFIKLGFLQERSKAAQVYTLQRQNKMKIFLEALIYAAGMDFLSVALFKSR